MKSCLRSRLLACGGTDVPFAGCVIALGVSLCLNVALGQKLRASPSSTPLTSLPRVMPVLAGISATGAALSVRYGAAERPKILYDFSPTCGWCERNWSNVKALAKQTEGRYQFVAVTKAVDVGDVVRAHNLRFDISHALTPSQREAYGFGATPRTMVVSSTGRVRKVWRGAYTHPIREEIERYLQVKLPGLDPPAAR